MKLVKSLWLIMLLHGGAAYSAGLQPEEVARFVSDRFTNLSIMDARVENRAQFWAAWDTGSGENREIHLALLTRKNSRATVVWSQVWAESYQPTLTILTGWRYDGNPMLALTFQQGAAAESLRLFGVDAAGHPVDIAQRDSAAVELRAVGRGELVLVNDLGSTPMRECLRWDEVARRVIGSPCEELAH